jgi:proliferating cell nuclear antigen PCNA
MRAVISDAKKCVKFTALFNNLKQFTNNILLNFKKDGIYIQCLDDSHCCLFEANLASKWFSTYDVKAPVTIGINLGMFYKVLNARHETQAIELCLQKNKPDLVFINFIMGASGNFDKYFELSLIDIQMELMNVVENETLVDLHMETKTFCEMISQFMIFDDMLTITFNEDKISLKASGSDGKMRTELRLDDVKEYVTAESITLVQSYSLRYINMMCHFNKLSADLYMGFSDTMPMLMKYDLGEDSYASFHLAPKITDEEEQAEQDQLDQDQDEEEQAEQDQLEQDQDEQDQEQEEQSDADSDNEIVSKMTNIKIK